jgi:hypothetical protein
MKKHGIWLAAALAGLVATCSPARAEDERGRWTFGLGAGILSTKDDIRNNSAALLLNEKGIPNDISDDQVVDDSIDLRQDDLLGRDTSVEERQTYSFSIAYGLTSWMSLQLDVGRYSGNVSNLDTLQISRHWVDINQDNRLLLDTNPHEDLSTPFHDASVPISAGRLTETPILLSALFRFRRDSPFNPILGAGVGMIFTDFKESGALRDLNSRILEGFQRTQLQSTNTGEEAANLQLILDRYGNTLGDTTCRFPANDTGSPRQACTLGEKLLEEQLAKPEVQNDPELAAFLRESYGLTINQAYLPQRPFITTQVENAFEYHFTGGAEYHFNDKWSAFVLGRYSFTSANLQVRISDNGNLVTPAQTRDASQRKTFETDQARFEFLSAENCDLSKRDAMIAEGLNPCLVPEGGLLTDVVTVQGGKINLSGFTLGFGFRYTF